MYSIGEFSKIGRVSAKTLRYYDEIGLMHPAYEELYRNGFKQNGPVMTFYHDEEFHQENATIEVCIPVEESEQVKGSDKVKKINPGMCATCVYTGPYHKLGEAYAAVLKWIEENKYEIASAPFDCYMNSPQEVKDPEKLVTKVCFPIK